MDIVFQAATCRTRAILSRVVKRAKRDDIHLEWQIHDLMNKSYPFLIETESSIKSAFQGDTNPKPDIILIEISTIKYDKDNKLTRKEFIDWVVNIMKIIPKSTTVIWVTAHNVQLSNKHYQIISNGCGIMSTDTTGSIFTRDRRFSQRVDCEDWLISAISKQPSHFLIKTSDCFEHYDSEFVFQCVENTPHMPPAKAKNVVDTYHYSRQAEPILLEFAYNQIKDIL